MAAASPPKRGAWRVGWSVVLGALVVLGLVAGVVQTTGGPGVTGLNDGVIWGLYINAYSVLLGVSGGVLVVLALADLLRVRSLIDVLPLAPALAAIGALMAMLAVAADLGHPLRAVEFLTSPNVTSMFVWDFVGVVLCFVLSIVYGMAVMRGTVGRVLAGVTVLVGVWALWVSGMVFGLVKARPGWFSPLMGPASVTLGITLGLSALIIVTVWLGRSAGLPASRRGRGAADPDGLGILGKALAVAAMVNFVFMVSQMVYETWPYARLPEDTGRLGALISGPHAYTIPTAMALMLATFLLIMWPGRNTSMARVVAAAISAVLATWTEKFGTLMLGLAQSTLSGPYTGTVRGTYGATWVEWAIVLGILALGTLLYTGAVRWLAVSAQATE